MVNELLKKPYILLDGGMGTMLQQNGLRPGENPMAFNITHPDLVEGIHLQYVQAGSDILLANTFGASRKKLSDTEYTPRQVITAAVGAARRAAGDSALVALDMGPIGELLAPLGTLTFDEAYELFKEQVIAGDQAGAQLVFIETMTDLNEVRAALLAVKENSELPVFITMTFEESGRTFTGCLAESFAIVAAAMGADAVGVNCSLGPKEIVPIMDRIAGATDLPVIMKPNAGLPDPLTGKYDLSPEDFAADMEGCGEAGIQIMGGCCGTDPRYIAALKEMLDRCGPPRKRHRERGSVVCSPSKVVYIDGVRVIGERINPTGKKRFRQALIQGDMDYVMEQAIEQADAGAHILDVNVGVPEVDEPAAMARVVPVIQSVTDLPLQIDSSNTKALETGLRYFGGKAIVNSVNGDQDVLDRVLPIVKKYGASVVGLTLDENGIPEKAEDRLKIARRIVDAAGAMGIAREDVFIDCLTLTVSAQPEGAKETLKAVGMVRQELGLNTVLGVSNISFGLPNRELINQTFLTMGMEIGLTLPIINPNMDIMMDAVAAFNLLSVADKDAEEYIARFSQREIAPRDKGGDGSRDIEYAISRGLPEDARRITELLLEQTDEMQIIDDLLIPALDRVGQRFEKGEIFLPQLLNSAGAAGEAFEAVKRKLSASGKAPLEKGTVIMATVKGDIHDIGKNIVKIILENYGYRVIDLGKDVPKELVVETAIRENIQLVGLSALMTTTLDSMEETITALRERGHKCRVMVGGAVLTPEYAMSIGADYYCRDAKDSVAAAREVFGE